MSENDVERAIVNFLQTRGWIIDRVQVGVFYTRDGRPMAIGKPGQPDWRAKRGREYLEVEIKATGKRPDKKQLEYLAVMRHVGVAATWADSLEMFAEWYGRQGFAVRTRVEEAVCR